MLPMTANIPQLGNEPAEQIVAWLKARLPSSWEVALTSRAELAGVSDGRVDAAIDIRGSNGTYTTVVVEIKQAFGPRDVERFQASQGRILRTLTAHIPRMVFAPWLSDRTQGLLRADGINYLDLTGNAFVRLENPTVYIETTGAKRDPAPLARGKARVQGPKAGRLIRTLVDVRPPYGVRDLATAANLTAGYVSRLLDALDDAALIKRSPKGRVDDVDVPNLLKRWTDSYDVFRTNKATTYLAPAGATQALRHLPSVESHVAVTGSFAAVRLAPVAAPALLTLYSDNHTALADELGLVPADEGGNVAVLRPYDPVVWERTTTDAGTAFVSPSQVALDCLTGNGRMPAEGEAVLQWMLAHEELWRLHTLPRDDAAMPS